MPTSLNVVAINGSTQLSSRTAALVGALLAQLQARLHIDTRLVSLAEIARPLGAALWRTELAAQVDAELQAIEQADLLVVGTPVYRGSYPGHFKHLFDLIGQDALAGKPVLLAATGGSDRHALVLEHQLRPLFGFLQALTLPVAVYAGPEDYDGYNLQSQPVQERIALAIERAVPLFPRHARASLAAAA